MEKEVQVYAEEKLEEVYLSYDLQKLEPISINSKLIEEEKTILVELLKEYEDVFAWEYSKMPRLDLTFVVHMLNVEPGTKPVAQLAKVFYTNIETQIVQEVQKLLATRFNKPIQHPKWLSNIVPVRMKNGRLSAMWTSGTWVKRTPKMSSFYQIWTCW